MPTKDILVLAIIGTCAGLLSGGLGVGGGLVIVPALTLFLAYSQHRAQGTSLTLMLPPIYAVAAYTYYRAGHAHLLVAFLLMLGFLAGGYLGAKIANKLPEKKLKQIFGLLVLAVSLKMFLG